MGSSLSANIIWNNIDVATQHTKPSIHYNRHNRMEGDWEGRGTGGGGGGEAEGEGKGEKLHMIQCIPQL